MTVVRRHSSNQPGPEPGITAARWAAGSSLADCAVSAAPGPRTDRFDAKRRKGASRFLMEWLAHAHLAEDVAVYAGADRLRMSLSMDSFLRAGSWLRCPARRKQSYGPARRPDPSCRVVGPGIQALPAGARWRVSGLPARPAPDFSAFGDVEGGSRSALWGWPCSSHSTCTTSLTQTKQFVAGRRTVLGLVIPPARLQLPQRETVLLALVGVDAFGPVVHGLPALGAPARLESAILQADIAVFLRGSVNLGHGIARVDSSSVCGRKPPLSVCRVRGGAPGEGARASRKHGTLLSRSRRGGGWWAARSQNQ